MVSGADYRRLSKNANSYELTVTAKYVETIWRVEFIWKIIIFNFFNKIIFLINIFNIFNKVLCMRTICKCLIEIKFCVSVCSSMLSLKPVDFLNFTIGGGEM